VAEKCVRFARKQLGMRALHTAGGGLALHLLMVSRTLDRFMKYKPLKWAAIFCGGLLGTLPFNAAGAELSTSPLLELEAKAQPDELAAGGLVLFELKIHNESSGPLTITSVTDSLPSDLLELQPAVGWILAAGAKQTATFTAAVSGNPGEIVENIITVVAEPVGGSATSFQAKAHVKIELAKPDDDGPPVPPTLIPNAVIGDRVWLDANKDGLLTEGETGVAGVKIQLYSTYRNKLVAETVSDADGKYVFKGEFPAQLYLKVKPGDAYLFTARRVGDNRALDNDIDPASGKSGVIDLTKSTFDDQPVAHATDWDIGLVPAAETSDEPGVAGPGFWKNHLDAWPNKALEIAGETYTQEEAVKLLTNGSDKSYTLIRSLIAALLNIASGTDSSCLAVTLAAADTWVKAHPPGSEVKDTDDAWTKEGKAIAETLEAYNDGQLCAPKRHESKTPVSIRPGKIEKENGNRRSCSCASARKRGARSSCRSPRIWKRGWTCRCWRISTG
jgi:hypothetical protein